MRTTNRIAYLIPLVLGACGSSGPTTIVVSGSGFTTDEGKPVKVALVNSGSDKVESTTSGTVTSGKITVTVMNVSPDTAYRIDVFIDRDSNGVCDISSDGVFSATTTGVAEGMAGAVTITSASTPAEACLAFGGGTLVVMGTGYTQNVVWHAALFKKTDATTYQKLGTKSKATTGGAIDIEFPGALVTGTFYRVDYYVDDNASDSCGSGDHVFRIDSIALSTGTSSVTLTSNADATQTPGACASF